MSKTTVLGIPFDDLSLDEAAERALALISERRSSVAVTPNAEILLAAQHDKKLRDILQRADLTVADGVGALFASWILGKPLRHRVPGIDLAGAVMARLARTGGSVYLLGAKPGIGELAARQLKAQYPGLCVAGIHDGYFSEAEEGTVLREINAVCPALLLVCMGSPRQEKWLDEHARRLSFGLGIGLGGALDVFAGQKRRAPAVLRRAGLEWLYRLICEPWRIMRMVRLPLLLLTAAKIRIREETRLENGKTDRFGGNRRQWEIHPVPHAVRKAPRGRHRL